MNTVNKIVNKARKKLGLLPKIYTRTQMLNDLIVHNNYRSYLEIGVNTPLQPGYNWTGLQCMVKHGVDPNVDTSYKMESDLFFKDYITQKYDICFVDGLHLFEQAYRDIINCAEHLNSNGCIVVHDCNPIEEVTQRRERASSTWHGDVWKAIIKIRQNRDDLIVCTVDTDEGCAFIKFGKQDKLKIDNDIDALQFDYLDMNRRHLLNLITVEEFKLRFLT